MNASSQPPPMLPRERDWLKLRLLAAAFVASTLACALVAWILSKTGARPEALLEARVLRTLFPVFVIVAVLCFFLSIAARRVMLSRALCSPAVGAFGRYFLVVLLANALAEVPSVLGLVYLLLGGTLEDALLFFAIALVTHVGAFPRRRTFEDGSAVRPADDGDVEDAAKKASS